MTILQVTRANGDVLYPHDTPDHRVQVQEEQVVSPQTAYQITSILSDPSAFCITYGCGALTIGRPWGVKTGTSEPYEDSNDIGETWTYGYTPDLVAGVWAGNSDNSPRPQHPLDVDLVSRRARLHDGGARRHAAEQLRATARPDGSRHMHAVGPEGDDRRARAR